MGNPNRIADVYNKDLLAFWKAVQFLFHVCFSTTSLSILICFFHSDIRNIHSILSYTNLRLQVNSILKSFQCPKEVS